MDNEELGEQKPTLLIAACVVLALAAIGFAIWGFSQKSDLDSANDTIAKQQAQLSGETNAANATERQQAAFNAKTVAKYRAIRTRLLREEAKEGASQKRIQQEVADLKQAKQQVADADSAEEKQKAQLNQATQETQLAAACARGTIDVINNFFSSNNASRGAQRAMNKLQDLEPQCEDVLHPGST